MLDCTASIVAYNNPPEMLRNAVESFFSCSLQTRLTVVDNSPTPALKRAFEELPVVYHFYGENAGYGKGHNWAIEHGEASRYHLIMNPDIVIKSGAVETLTAFMDAHPDVGMVSPRVLNKDGTDQCLNKRYPNVMDLFARRFLPRPFKPLTERRLERYEMRDVGYGKVCDVEVMSGAFMFCRKEVLKSVGGFDPRYFLYFEDFDLSRKIQMHGFRTVYCPDAGVIHYWGREAHKKLTMTAIFIVNMCRYFNKWGWRWL